MVEEFREAKGQVKFHWPSYVLSDLEGLIDCVVLRARALAGGMKMLISNYGVKPKRSDFGMTISSG